MILTFGTEAQTRERNLALLERIKKMEFNTLVCRKFEL